MNNFEFIDKHKKRNPIVTRDFNGANIGFEEKLWKAADKLRSNLDAAQYKHIVLGLIFLKYVSDVFYEKYLELEKKGLDKENKKEYINSKNFWIPEKARWNYLQTYASKSNIGKIIDNAMNHIEKENSSLKYSLPKIYSSRDIDQERIGELIELVGTIGLGSKENRSKDILGRVYEFFLDQFANSEGKNGGQYYTPRAVVRLLVSMLEPYSGIVYDPCCGSGGMFVQSEEFVELHGGKSGDMMIYGQESNPTAWRLCKMNLAIRKINGNIGKKHADSFKDDLHKALKADYIIANPPFNSSDWGTPNLTNDKRWKFGLPSNQNANFAWVQHFISHLSPSGTAGFVLSNGSLSSNTSNDGEIRKKIIDEDLVDCIVSLPSQLFYSTSIAACLWFITKNKNDEQFRSRKGETLFIEAAQLGELVDRTHRDLSSEVIKKISDTYHSWKKKNFAMRYEDIHGFCQSVKINEIKKHNYALVPGRFTGCEPYKKIKFTPTMQNTFAAMISKRFSRTKNVEGMLLNTLEGISYD